MKASEIRQKSNEEISKELLDLRKAQFAMRMQLATQQLTNTSQLAILKKGVARIKTIQHERASGK